MTTHYSLSPSFYFVLILLLCLANPQKSQAQCTPNNTPDCNNGNLYFQVVLSEFGGDAGQSDSVNDAIVELSGPANTNIAGMVITNTEWAVVLPAGSILRDPDGDGVGHFVLICEASNLSSFTTNSSGLSCAECDFPGLDVDINPIGNQINGFDMCDQSEWGLHIASSISTYNFTLDNGACGTSLDGDQVIVFQPDGTVQDAAFYGGPDATLSNGGAMTIGGSSGNCGSKTDHVSVQIAGISYTLGDNDDNGIVNDYAGLHLGFKGDGGNATGVNWMPSVDPDGDGVFSDTICYTVPSLSDPVWEDVGFAPSGCNSTYIRMSGTDGSQGQGNGAQNPSHNNDPDLDFDFGPEAADTPSSCSLPTIWGYTDHPTPGFSNDIDVWNFYVFAGDFLETNLTQANELTMRSGNEKIFCNGGLVTFAIQVYNFQQVEPTIMTSAKAGSFLNDGTTNYSWILHQTGHASAITSANAAIPSNNDGITTLYFTTNISADVQNFTLVWDDYTNCCGSGNISTVVGRSGTNAQNECYEDAQVEIIVGEPITLSDNAITCPGDFAAGVGMIDFGGFVTSPAASITYELREGVIAGQEQTTGTIAATNATGIFELPNILITPFAIVLRDNTNCGPDAVITVENDCAEPPFCPEITASTTDDLDGNICPNQTVCFDITAFMNLPENGTIDYFFDTNPNFNPYANEGTYLGSTNINGTMGANCPDDGSSVFISELSDPASSWQCNRFIEIYNGGPCSQDLTGWTLRAIGNNNIVVTFPLFGTINAGEALVASAGTGGSIDCAQNSTVNPDFTFAEDWSGGAPGSFNGQARDGAILYDNLNTIIDVAVLGTVDNNDWFENSLAVRLPTICEGTGDIGLTLCDENSSCPILISNWITETNEPPTPGFHAVNANICPNANAAETTIDQFCYTFDNSFCNLTANGDFMVKAVINPFTQFSQSGVNCSENDDERTEIFTLNMTCPMADLTSEIIEQCVGDGVVNLEITVTNGPANLSLNIGSAGIIPVAGNPYATGTHFVQISNGNTPTNGEIVVSLGIISTANNALCEGIIDADEVLISINPNPTATVENHTNFLGCAAGQEGTVTFAFSGQPPFDFTYSSPMGNVDVANVGSSHTITAFAAGDYDILAVNDANGCEGTVISNVKNVLSPMNFPMATAQDFSICNGNIVDLTTQILFNIDETNDGNLEFENSNANAIGAIDFYSINPTGLPPNILNNLKLTGADLQVNISNIQTYYFIFENAATGCSDIGSFEIFVSENPVANSVIITDCEQVGDIGIYDLNAAISAINGGATGVSVSFYGNLIDANLQQNALPLIFSTLSDTLIFATVTDLTTGCFSISEIVLTGCDCDFPPLEITCGNTFYATADWNNCEYSSSLLEVPTLSDNCGILSITNDAPPFFNAGYYLVNWTATEVNGNTASCLQWVMITDVTLPKFTSCPTAITVSAESPAGANVNWILPIVVDNCFGDLELISTHNSGDFFSTGTTIVTYTAFDESGNSEICSFFVTVNPTTPSVPDSNNSTAAFQLFQNYPNPFSNQTTIAFNLPNADFATLTIYDFSGRVLKKYDGEFESGWNEILVDNLEIDGGGLLFYELKTRSDFAVGKMILKGD